MPAGGEPDKLGNRYEAIWTIHELLDLIRGDATGFTCEPLVEGQGIEFIKVTAAGAREFHSVKFQTTANYWVPSILVTPGKNGRSIVSDLFDKLKADPLCGAHFVSQVSANDLRLISDEAANCSDLAAFLDRSSVDRREYFRKHLVPLGGTEDETFALLKRLRVITITQDILIQNLEERIRYVMYANNGDIQPLDVRLFLGDFLLDHLGQNISREILVDALNGHGYLEADWRYDQRILGRIQERNDSYLRSVKGQLINGKMIPRSESQAAFDQINKEESRYGMFVGTAGRGKSCAMAGVLDLLREAAMPFFALRLDTPYIATTPSALGQELGFPMSPVKLLAAVADGRRCVFLLDQLDALSPISGRKTITWALLEDLLAETKKYPNLRVLLACRDFDLKHDYRLTSLVQREEAVRIEMGLLTEATVRAQIRLHGASETHLSPEQIELLRTPMHLSLYLEGKPADRPYFRTVIDLYNLYWDRKRSQIQEFLNRPPKWTEVIDQMCDELSANQTLTASQNGLEDNYYEDVRAMASANVLTLDLGTYRFFHEGFFDYAFARRFAQKTRTLVDVLLKDGEQHLFRRAQVRQILAYLREDPSGRKRYYAELTALMTADGIRPHLISLVMDWQSSLPDPTMEEAKILKLA